MIGAVFAYLMAAAMSAGLLAVFCMDNWPQFLDELGPEGKVIAVIGIGLVWPVLVVAGVAWLMRAVVRGITQIARAVRPAPVEPLPKATAKDKS